MKPAGLLLGIAALGVGLSLAGGQPPDSHSVEALAPARNRALSYEITGQGPPVVLLHAGAMDRRMWDAQAEILSKSFAVIRYDLRGHGDSQDILSRYSEADDLEALLKFLGVPRAHLVGLEYGAAAAIDFALARPEMAASLVAASPDMSGYDTGPDPVIDRILEELRAGRLDTAADLWVDQPGILAGKDPALRERVRKIARGNVKALAANDWVKRWIDPRAVKRLKEIRCPTLVVAGEAAVPWSWTEADLLAKEVASAEKIVIANAGLLVNMERPEDFNRAVVRFLERAPRLEALPKPASREGLVPVMEPAIHYETAGKGPAVVFLEPGNLDSRVWDDQVEAFAKDFIVIRYDRRGVGRSPAPRAAYSQMEDLEDLLAFLHVPRAHIVGNSLGGRHAIDFALLHPEKAASIVLVGAALTGYQETPPPNETVSFAWYERTRRLLLAGENENAITQLLDDPPGWLAYAAGRPAVRERLRPILLANIAEWSRNQYLELPEDTRAADRLSEIRVPVLVVSGDQDAPRLRRIAAYLARGIPGARTRVFSPGGHFPQVESPVEFNRVVLEFLNSAK